MSRVEEVRAAADIVKLVGDYVKLRKAGVNLIGLCPFHQEKTPSFAVHPTKQIFHCFGCGVGGDVFKFVMLIENLSFPEALRRVAEKLGIALRLMPDEEAYDASARERAVLYKIHEAAANFYAERLGATAEGRAARAYLADRGVTDQAVGQFRLGYAPSEGQALWRCLKQAGFSAELLAKSGLVLRDEERDRYLDRFRRRIIFPILSESGRVAAFGGRALGDDLPKYLNSPETPIYNKGRVLYHLDRAASAVRKQDYAVLVEGYMDCIAVASSGIENVVASCGTSLTENQIRLLARSARRVVVNYDPDSAGIAAAERSLNLLLEAGFDVKVLDLPAGLDPDSFIRQKGGAAYREALSVAPSYFEYLTDRSAAKHDLSRPEGKVAAANSLLPYLSRVPSLMLRAELANRMAERLRLDERLLREELGRAAREKLHEMSPGRELGVAKFNHAVKLLLRACLEEEALADEFAVELMESGDCEGLIGEGIFRRIADARRRGEKIEVAQLADSLEEDERRLLYDSLFWEGKSPDRDSARSYRLGLRRERAEREQKKLIAAIEAAIRGQDQGKVAELQAANAKLAKELSQLGRS